MKKFLVVCVFLMISLAGFSQDAWKGFWGPVNKGLNPGEKLSLGTSTWLFRPTAAISAVSLNYNKDLKQIETAAFSKAGVGISYTHFKTLPDGTLYDNFAINGLVLLTTSTGEKVPVNLAVTVSALQFVNMGVGYDFGVKTVFGLIGIVYKFN